MTQLAPSLSSFDRTMEAPRVAERFDGDIESTGTIYIDQVDLTGALATRPSIRARMWTRPRRCASRRWR